MTTTADELAALQWRVAKRVPALREECRTCGGKGYAPKTSTPSLSDAGRFVSSQDVCLSCHGTGWIVSPKVADLAWVLAETWKAGLHPHWARSRQGREVQFSRDNWSDAEKPWSVYDPANAASMHLAVWQAWAEVVGA